MFSHMLSQKNLWNIVDLTWAKPTTARYENIITAKKSKKPLWNNGSLKRKNINFLINLGCVEFDGDHFGTNNVPFLFKMTIFRRKLVFMPLRCKNHDAVVNFS